MKGKALISAIVGFLSSFIGILAIPVLLLVVCNVVDYITGIAASVTTGNKITSYRSFKGILKKICTWLLVLVGAVIDGLLLYATETIGLTLPFTFLVACIVAIWLICNELLSILENIVAIGAPVPRFLKTLVKYIKAQSEKAADITKVEEKDDK